MKKNRIRIGLLALAIAASFAATASADQGGDGNIVLINESFGVQRNDNGCAPRDFDEFELVIQPLVDPITGDIVPEIEGSFRAFNTNFTPDRNVRGVVELLGLTTGTRA